MQTSTRRKRLRGSTLSTFSHPGAYNPTTQQPTRYLTGAVSRDNPANYELDPDIEQRIRFNDQGLVPTIVQAYGSGEVLMLAWMDSHALAYTLATKQGTYFSRSRNEYWIKGLTSGHTQKVISLKLDCDGDTILMEVEQRQAACHTGDRTCFDQGTIL